MWNARANRRLAIPCLALTLAVVTLGASRHWADARRGPDQRVAYFATFSGIATDGRQIVWRGAAAGLAVGEMTVLLRYAGREVDAAKRKRPVRGTIVIAGAPAQSLAAEVEGTVDWQGERLRLEGEVSAGPMRGARVAQSAHLLNSYDLSGELLILPAGEAK